MAKVRVYELAKKLGVPAADLVDKLKALGEDVSSNFSSVDEEVVSKLGGGKKAVAAPAKAAAPKPPAPAPALKASPVAAALHKGIRRAPTREFRLRH